MKNEKIALYTHYQQGDSLFLVEDTLASYAFVLNSEMKMTNYPNLLITALPAYLDISKTT